MPVALHLFDEQHLAALLIRPVVESDVREDVRFVEVTARESRRACAQTTAWTIRILDWWIWFLGWQRQQQLPVVLSAGNGIGLKLCAAPFVHEPILISEHHLGDLDLVRVEKRLHLGL